MEGFRGGRLRNDFGGCFGDDCHRGDARGALGEPGRGVDGDGRVGLERAAKPQPSSWYVLIHLRSR